MHSVCLCDSVLCGMVDLFSTLLHSGALTEPRIERIEHIELQNLNQKVHHRLTESLSPGAQVAVAQIFEPAGHAIMA
jgi:hypothetical protein